MIRSKLAQPFESRRVRTAGGAVLLFALLALIWWEFPHIHRKPPSIFDAPVDGVLDYLAGDDFNRLSVKERVDYLAGIMERFKKFNQGDSVIASAFFAGLTGPANEKLVNNARVLGKDIFVEGASQFLALTTDAERDAFIDKWLVKWARFGAEATGRPEAGTDQDVLNRMSRQARRDAQSVSDLNSVMAQQLVDFWNRDVSSVASPKEQAQIFQFAPAIRQRLLNRGQ